MGNAQYTIKSCCCKDEKIVEEVRDKWCENCHLHILDPNNMNSHSQSSINEFCKCTIPKVMTNNANNPYLNMINMENPYNENEVKNANDYNANNNNNKISEINKSVTAVFNKFDNNNSHSQKAINTSNNNQHNSKNNNHKIKEIDNTNQIKTNSINNNEKHKEEAKTDEKCNSNNNKNSIKNNNNANEDQNFILSKLKKHNNQEESDSSKRNETPNSNNTNIVKPGNSNHTTKCLKNYTFSSENNSLLKCDNFIRSIIRNKDGSNKKINDLQFIPNQKISVQAEYILANEFYFNFYAINNKLQRNKTKEVSQTKRYVLLTRISLRFSRNKNTFISFGTIFNEIKLYDITKIELIKNPFSKIHLYTINITYGKENFEISISSEDEKEVESWFKLINYLMKSNFI